MFDLRRLPWLALPLAFAACGDSEGNGNGNGNGSGGGNMTVDMGFPDMGQDMGQPMEDRPTVRATPDEVDFDFVLIDTEVSQFITIENTSEIDTIVEFDNFVNIDLCRFQATVPFCIEDQGEDEGFSLDAGETLQLELRATSQIPRVVENGSFDIIFCDEPEGCSAEVGLTSESVASAFDCAVGEEPSFDIGLVNLNNTIIEELDCENIISLPVSLSAPRFESAADDALSIEGDALAGEVAPGETITLPIQVVGGTQEQDKEGGLILEYAVGGINASNRVNITAQAGGADLQLDRETVEFGQCSTLATCSETVIVTNAGVEDLVIENFQGTQSNVGMLVIEPPTATLMPGESLSLVLSIDAAAAGDFNAIIDIESNDPDREEFELPLSGTGITTGTCNGFGIDRTVVDFGTASLFRSAQQNILLNNPSGSPCLIRGVRLTAGSDAAITVPLVIDQFSVPANGRAVIPVDFTPTTIATSEASLRFQISSPFDPNRSVDVSGQSVEDPLLTNQASEIDLGTVPMACARTSTRAAFLNFGDTTTVVNAVSTLEGQNAFSINDAPTGGVSPLTPRRFTVDFEPTQDGPVSDTLQVQTSLGIQFVSVFGERADSRTERFVQASSGAADVLLVVDNDNNNGQNATSVSQTAAAWFARAAANDIDLRVGVISPDVFNEDGLFVPIDGGPERVVDVNSTPTPEEALQENIGDLGSTGQSREAFEAVRRALLPRALRILNPNFYRPDAHLAVVFIQDEEDLSDLDADEIEVFLNQLKGRRNRERLTVATVTGGAEGCDEPTKSASGSPRLEALRAATGGPFHSICMGAPYPEAFIDRVLGVRIAFPLDSVPDTDSFSVTLDGTAVSPSAYEYDVDSNALIFDVPPPSGSEILVTYSTACDPID